MASYDIGGEYVIGDYNVGFQEGLTSRYTSLGRPWYIGGSPIYSSRGQLIPYLRTQNAYIEGEMTVPERYDELFVTNGVHCGVYADITNQVIVYAFSTDGTPDTVYYTTSNSISDYADDGELNFHTFLAKSNRNVYYTLGAYSQDLGVNLTWSLCNSNLSAPNQGFILTNELPIPKQGGGSITIDDLPKEPTISQPGGGDGDYDNNSDVIPFPSLPTLGAHNCGLLAVYNPTIGELQNFSAFLWSRDVFDTIKKFIASPMELIVSLAIVPVTPTVGDTSTIKIGGIDTEVSSTLIGNQYMAFDCGTLNINEYYGSALDYGQYTKISIFLPYIGVRELKTDEVMDGSVTVRYNIDLVSGACVAFVRCQRHGLNAVLYSFEGNIATQIPISSRDFSTVYSAMLRGVVDTAISTGGGVGQSFEAGLQSALSVMASKPTMTRSGSISSSAGLLGIHTPYVIIERPIQSVPLNSRSYYGAPSNITARLGDLRGYTECETEILDIPCTDAELEMIREKLTTGIIL